MTSAEDTGSSFIGFYPSEDPVIAFSGFVEHGEYSKFMIRQFIEAYLDKNYKVVSPNSISDGEKASQLAGLDENTATDVTSVTTNTSSSESVTQ